MPGGLKYCSWGPLLHRRRPMRSFLLGQFPPLPYGSRRLWSSLNFVDMFQRVLLDVTAMPTSPANSTSTTPSSASLDTYLPEPLVSVRWLLVYSHTYTTSLVERSTNCSQWNKTQRARFRFRFRFIIIIAWD